MAHQLQLFSMMLLLFAVLDFKPAIKWASHREMSLVLVLILGLSFIISIGKKTYFKKLLVLLGLCFSYLLVLNTLYLYPTLGVMTLCLSIIGLYHIFSQKLMLRHIYLSPNVQWQDVLICYAIQLVPILLISEQQIKHPDLFFHASIISGLSVLYISLKYLNRLLNISSLWIVLCVVVSSSLFYFEETKSLKFISLGLFIVNTALLLFISFRSSAIRSIENQYSKLFQKPELIVIAYFLIAAVIGCFLLQIPWAQTEYQGSFDAGEMTKHSILDSFFTAMSAICVTGLTVLDTPVDFSFFGQFIILLLIQLGGLGITTLSAWILLILSDGRLSFNHEDTLHSMSGQTNKIEIKSFLKKIMAYFFAIEFLGALLLFLFFSQTESWNQALWRSIFTSISAFCNAGFALASDNLVSYQTSPFVLLTVSFLIIAGGFAPLMVLDLPRKFRQNRLCLQEKLALVTTLTLLFSGFFIFLIVEWAYSLENLSVIHKLTNAWFQSVTTRTAGFNSVDLTETRTLTQMFMMVLMFIGGNPGSTAGGVKTITIAVLAFTALSAIRENNETKAFYKMIPNKTIYKAILIVFLGFLTHFAAFFFLTETQNIDAISLLFEVFSAFGTVGLSTGATVLLDEIGKMIIIFCMLAGRVGPLTFVLLLIKTNSKQNWKTPEEDVFIT